MQKTIARIFVFLFALLLACFTAPAQDTVVALPISPDTSTLHPDTTLLPQDSILAYDTTKSNPVLDVLTPDTLYLRLDSSKVYYFYNDFESKGPYFAKEIDTVITGIEKYDPPMQRGNYFATLGNPGLASVNMVYKPNLSSGYNFGIHALDMYRFFNDSLKYHWVGRPYTHLFYIMGSKKEQNLHVEHAQNVASWFTLGLNFRYVSSPGFYVNQLSDDKNFALKTRFQTKNYRYVVLANYIHNILKVEENGGIRYDTVFEQNIKTSRDGILVHLNGANNTFKENSYYIKQSFNIKNRNRFMPDTTKHGSFFGEINPGSISLSTQISQSTWLYEQPLSDNNGFYHTTYDSVNPTYDSTYIYKIENRLSWTNSDNAKPQFLTFDFALRHLYVENTVDSAKTVYNQLIPTGEVNFRITKDLKLHFFGDFVTGNSYVGDFNLVGNLYLKTKFGELSYELHNASLEPERFYQSYASNHFRWENQFKKQYFLINKFKYNYKSLSVWVNLFAIENFVYLDSLAIPDQMGSNLQVLQAGIRKLINIGNWSLRLKAIYQKTSTTHSIRVPELLGDASLYYTNDLFKKAAILQTGVDAFYNTPYFSYAYMPATRNFYVQNDKELGDYIYADLFLNLQIKRARLFLKYYNLGFLFNDFRYYTVPGYPGRDGGFRFGVSWMFYD